MLVSEQEIRSRLSAARLPTMPQMLAKLMEQCQNEKAGLPELAKLVSLDPGLTAKILKISQSAAYRRRGQIVGLEQSMMSLGLDMIRSLVISESIFQTFNNFASTARVDLRAFWKHSLMAAIIARQAAKAMKYPNPNEAYLAGLLHDIGRLALLSVAPKEYLHHFHAPDDTGLCTVEQRTLQISHPEAGALVVERWKMDSFIADSVLYHHEAGERISDGHALIRIVWLAHILASCGTDDAAIESAAQYSGASMNDISIIMKGVEETVEQAANFLGIDLDGIDQPKPAAPALAAPDPLGDEIHQFVHASELGRFFSGFKDEERLLRAICGTACSEFQFDKFCLLMREEDRNVLVAHPVIEDQQRLAGFSIPLGKTGPITIAALQDWLTVLAPDDAANGIVEEQLLRIIGSERLVCLPLTANAQCVAVLLAGTNADHIADIRSNERALKTFRVQAAIALTSLRAKNRTDQERATRQEEQFREATRRVAHEINNPLAIIKNYLHVLDKKLSRQEPISSEISILGEELDRVGKIINEFAEQPTSPSSVSADVNRSIKDIAHLFGNTEFSSSASIVARTHPEGGFAGCSAGKLKQILLNLVKNAVEAMPQGGKVVLANDGTIMQHGRAFISISVKDNGPGIPQEVQAQLFSPVISTKGADHRGLGLNIVYSLVKEIHGSITCQSGPAGTIFRILVPSSEIDAVQVSDL